VLLAAISEGISSSGFSMICFSAHGAFDVGLPLSCVRTCVCTCVWDHVGVCDCGRELACVPRVKCVQ
jgi:hypothetical protein